MADYCDGQQYKDHPLFQTDQYALQLFLYYDDIEAVNPLGSSATIHKLGLSLVHVNLKHFVLFFLKLLNSFRFILLYFG